MSEKAPRALTGIPNMTNKNSNTVKFKLLGLETSNTVLNNQVPLLLYSSCFSKFPFKYFKMRKSLISTKTF